MNTSTERRLRKHRLLMCALLMVIVLLTAGFTRPKTVKVIVDGATQTVETSHHHAHSILHQAGVKLGKHDEVVMSTHKVEQGTELRVYRAVPVTVTLTGKEPHTVQTAKQTVGDLMKHLGYSEKEYVPQPGPDTAVTKDMSIAVLTVAEAQERARQLEAEAERRRTCVETSRGWIRYKQKLTMEASAYLPSDGGGGGITATGAKAAHGIAAVDPKVIPLGSRLYIPGYGFALAADTGGIIKGHMIDLCMESYNEAIQFGRRDITVYVLE